MNQIRLLAPGDHDPVARSESWSVVGPGCVLAPDDHLAGLRRLDPVFRLVPQIGTLADDPFERVRAILANGRLGRLDPHSLRPDRDDDRIASRGRGVQGRDPAVQPKAAIGIAI